MPELLANLNPPQHAAVTLPSVHALILAGAGSGKTRVLTTRIAWLIATGQTGPGGVLAVTFTNKAAREMMLRLSTLVSVNPRGMWVGTFHGLCNRLLRAHHRDAALPPSFQILDSADQLALVKRVMRALNVDDQKHPPRQVQHFISGQKEEGRRPDDVIVADESSRRMVEIYRAYDLQCQREGVVDFAELLLRSVELLERHELLREHYRTRFRHILVDEFQDTNDLQYRWLRLLCGAGGAIFAVGDDDQSIYAFRGANVANMAAFEREYAHDRLIRLEQNYRSHAHILGAANSLIRQNSRRLGKELWTDAGEGEPVRVHESGSDVDEARWLLEQIRALINEGSLRSQIAILYRSNAQSRVIEHALFSAGVPYRVYGGLRFFERAEVKHALSYLRLLENVDDDSAFLRVVNFPARGIGARTLEQLQDHARQQGLSLYRAVSTLGGGAATKLLHFVMLMERLREATTGMPLTDVVDRMLDVSGLLRFYESERDGEERRENLRELVNAAATYLGEEGIAQDTPASVGLARQQAADGAVSSGDTGPGQGAAEGTTDTVLPEATAIGTVTVSPLAGFLAHASLEAGDGQAGEGVDSVQMMTVHSAKGLEFDNVFITGLEEGLFPHENSASDPDGLEEERRLMYVAITRARERLHLSFAQSRMLHGQTRYNLRSRFLEELPEEHLKWLTPKDRAFGSAHGGAFGGGFGGALGGASGGGPGGGAQRGARAGGGPAWRKALGQGRGASGANPDGPSDGGYRYAGAGSRFKVGQLVRHARFGEGAVVRMEGSGDDERAQINFGAHGVKWLALSIAKLDPA